MADTRPRSFPKGVGGTSSLPLPFLPPKPLPKGRVLSSLGGQLQTFSQGNQSPPPRPPMGATHGPLPSLPVKGRRTPFGEGHRQLTLQPPQFLWVHDELALLFCAEVGANRLQGAAQTVLFLCCSPPRKEAVLAQMPSRPSPTGQGSPGREAELFLLGGGRRQTWMGPTQQAWGLSGHEDPLRHLLKKHSRTWWGRVFLPQIKPWASLLHRNSEVQPLPCGGVLAGGDQAAWGEGLLWPRSN